MFSSHRLQNQAESDKDFVLIVQNIIATGSYKCFPSHLNNASTLRCETSNSCFCKNSNAGEAKFKKCYVLTSILLIQKDATF